MSNTNSTEFSVASLRSLYEGSVECMVDLNMEKGAVAAMVYSINTFEAIHATYGGECLIATDSCECSPMVAGYIYAKKGMYRAHPYIIKTIRSRGEKLAAKFMDGNQPHPMEAKVPMKNRLEENRYWAIHVPIKKPSELTWGNVTIDNDLPVIFVNKHGEVKEIGLVYKKTGPNFKAAINLLLPHKKEFSFRYHSERDIQSLDLSKRVALVSVYSDVPLSEDNKEESIIRSIVARQIGDTNHGFHERKEEGVTPEIRSENARKDFYAMSGIPYRKGGVILKVDPYGICEDATLLGAADLEELMEFSRARECSSLDTEWIRKDFFINKVRGKKTVAHACALMVDEDGKTMRAGRLHIKNKEEYNFSSDADVEKAIEKIRSELPKLVP